MKKIQTDFNSTKVVLTGIILGTIGVLSFIVQPGLVQGFVTELLLSEASANSLAFDEMLGVALATYLTSFIKDKVSWRVLVTAALIITASGNFLSALYLSNIDYLSIVRFFTGVGEGVIISMSFTIIGLSKRSERNLAAYLVLLLTYGALGLWLMPTAFDLIGLDGIFIFWGILTSLTISLYFYIPHSVSERTEMNSNAIEMPLIIKLTGLFGILLFNLAIGIAWANLFLIGMEIENDEQAIANALLVSQFIAIIGALIPIFMEKRFGIFKPIILTILGSGLSISILLVNSPSYVTFLIVICSFNFLWNFGLPFIFTAVGNMDTKGTMVSLAIALQMTGLGFAPFFASLILGNEGTYFDIKLLIVVLYALSLIPLLFSLLQHKKQLQLIKGI